MNSERWKIVKGLFEAVVELTPKERKRFLEKSCGHDAELRREVENLLASSDEAKSFMESPAVGEVAHVIEANGKKLENGKCFGHYEIIEQIGAGGMGEVYLALDEQLERHVAIKILNEEFSRHESNLQRFIREAKAASALNHPNILVIHEIGEAENRHYIVSEFITGQTLRELIKESPPSLPGVLDIAIQIANALTAAHTAHIVHRDIKPENIIVRPDGYVKILDFGLAKLVEQRIVGSEDVTDQQNHTANGVILGTVSYMSPEQAKGERVDERTDIFSFGAVVYEMLSGRTPFAGDSVSETFANLINAQPPPLSRIAENVPDELQRIVARTLRKNRDERYQTMKSLLADLKDLRENLEFQDRLDRTTAPHREDPKTQRMNVPITDAPRLAQRKRILLKTALALGVIGVVAISLWFFSGRENSFTAIGVQKPTQLTMWSGLDDFSSMSPDGNSVAYCSDHNGSFEIYVKAQTPGAKEIQLTNDGKQNLQPAWSPAGQHIAYYSKLRGGVWVIPASGGEAKQITDFGSHPAWSPDSKQIAFQSHTLNDLGVYADNGLPSSTLWLVSAQGGEPRQLTQIGNPQGGHGSPAWSPDGNRIAFEVGHGIGKAIWTVSLKGNDPRCVSADPKHNYWAPVYAPDGQSIFYHTFEVFQQRLNSQTGEPVGEPIQIAGIVTRPSAIRRFNFSADGKRIAFNILRRSESISSVTLKANSAEATGPPSVIFSNAVGRNMSPVFSPDGKHIAFSTCGTGGVGCDIWLANADGSNQTQLTTAESFEGEPSWFPNGEQVAYISDRTGYMTYWAIDLNTKRERMLFDLKRTLGNVRLSPDGKQIAFSLTQGSVVNVWTSSLEGGELKQLTFDNELMGSPIWSPDGKHMALQMKRGDDTHVMIMPSEGGTPTQLTFDKGQSWIYGWSPDGDKILFAGQRDGFWNVRWVSRSTKKQQQLTDYKKLNSFVRYPSWSPDGKQVAYEYAEATGNIWVADLK